ncbi:hypothetical protein ABPG74_003325 [Tetrahymena malaccensis]
MEEVQASQQDNYQRFQLDNQGGEYTKQREGDIKQNQNQKNNFNHQLQLSQNQSSALNNQLPSLGKKTNSYDRLNTIKVIQKVNQPGFKHSKLTESLIKQAAIEHKLNKKGTKNDQQAFQSKQILMRTEPDERDDLQETQKKERTNNVKINPFFRQSKPQQQLQQMQSNGMQRTIRLPRSYSQAKIIEKYHTQPNEEEEEEEDENQFQNQDHAFQTQKSFSRKKFNNNISNNSSNIPTRSRVFSSVDYRSTYYSEQNKSQSAFKTTNGHDLNSPEKGQTKYSKVIQFFIDKYNIELEEKKLLEERIQDLKRKIIQENQKLKEANYEAQQINDSNNVEIQQIQRIESDLIDIHRKKQYEQERIAHYEQIIQQVQVQNELILIKIENEKKQIQEAEHQCKVLKRRSDSQFKQKIHVKKQRNFSLKQISHREFRVKNLTNSTQTFQKDLKEIMEKYE